MSLRIVFSIRATKLTVEHDIGNGQAELIQMPAKTGGWDGYKPLPRGSWLITENPSGNRNYFGLFFRDGNINDQFRHDAVWRDGIRFGFHLREGSHGCIMTEPPDVSNPATFSTAQAQWARIQELIRTVRSPRLIRYQNNENPARRDPAIHQIRSYGDLIVTL